MEGRSGRRCPVARACVPSTDAALLAGGTACYTALSAACEAPGAALTGLGRR